MNTFYAKYLTKARSAFAIDTILLRINILKVILWHYTLKCVKFGGQKCFKDYANATFAINIINNIGNNIFGIEE